MKPSPLPGSPTRISTSAKICSTVAEMAVVRRLTRQRLPHVDVPPGVRVQGKQLVVYGQCAACAQPKKGREARTAASRGERR